MVGRHALRLKLPEPMDNQWQTNKVDRRCNRMTFVVASRGHSASLAEGPCIGDIVLGAAAAAAAAVVGHYSETLEQYGSFA
jgi:hypothetical protein